MTGIPIPRIRQLTIAVDFDGTCVEHRYPAVGRNVPFAVSSLQEIVETGHRIIIYTMRDGKELADAARWYQDNGIKYFGVNQNPEQKSWTQSPKAYADYYIDDAAVGCPLRLDMGGRRHMVDWQEVMKILRPKILGLPSIEDTNWNTE